MILIATRLEAKIFSATKDLSNGGSTCFLNGGLWYYYDNNDGAMSC